MAAVMGPSIAQHPSPFRAAHNISISQSRQGFHPPPSAPPKSVSTQPSTARDPFYRHENAARLCARFITHLFACPEYPPSSSGSTVKLPYFIAYALHQTKLHASVTFAALVLLQRLKARFPTARGSSGHRLFVSAFMIASKVICDDTYSNKSWSIVAQSMFQLREINQMEREMCQYLDWELNVDPVTLQEFEAMIRKDFAGPGPYPTYILPSPSKATPPPPSTVFTSSTPTPGPTSSNSSPPSPSPYAPQRYPSPPKPVRPSPPPAAPLAHPPAPSYSPPDTPETPSPSYSTSSSPASPPKPVRPSPPPAAPLAHPPAPSYSPPDTPETPSPSYSTSSSPASTASPKTPHSIEDHTARIVSAESSPVSEHNAMPVQQQQHQVSIGKSKMFAFAIPSVW